MTIRHGEFIGRDVQDDIIAHIPKEAGTYEWVDGRIMEVSEPSAEHGWVGMRLSALLATYVDAHKLGNVFGLDTLFLLQEEPRIVRGPDIAFVDKSRPMPEVSGVWRLAPDLVIEVQSKSQSGNFMRKKTADFLAAGVRLVWIVDPKTRTVVRHRSGEDPITLREGDVLDGEDIVPGFRCPVADCFMQSGYCRP